jgi:hypothetical protein
MYSRLSKAEIIYEYKVNVKVKKYTLENVARLQEWVMEIYTEVRQLIHEQGMRKDTHLSASTDCVLPEMTTANGNRNREHVLSQIFNSPTYSAFMAEFYVRTWDLLSSVLYIPSCPSLTELLPPNMDCLVLKTIAKAGDELTLNM